MQRIHQPFSLNLRSTSSFPPESSGHASIISTLLSVSPSARAVTVTNARWNLCLEMLAILNLGGVVCLVVWPVSPQFIGSDVQPQMMIALTIQMMNEIGEQV